ncbi:MAG: hypothetical protein IPH85_03580 [Ignavibacteria bacterium]|nr:hypothetical protein [Ignavibacteria bacterium]
MKRTFGHIATLVLLCCSLTAPLAAQWKEALLPPPYDQGYYLDVYFLPGNQNLGWVCGMNGEIIRTTDGGASWRGSTIPGAFLEYVQFLTPSIGYVSGHAGVFRSDDGGITWRDISPFDPNFEKGWGSYWINQNEGLYFVGGCASGIQAFYRTTDAGQSWTVSYGTEPMSGLSDGIIFRNGSGFAVSSGVLWRTTDFGRSWSIYSRTGSKVWSEELAISGNAMLIPTAGNTCDGNASGIGSLRYSNDAGRSWREYQTGANMFGSFLLDERRGWGVGNDRAVLYTDDAGESWTNRNCGIRGNIDDIFFINDTLGWAVGQGVYRSNFNAAGPKVAIVPADEVIMICKGDSAFVEARSAVDNYSWSDGVKSPGRYLTEPGRYIVSVYDRATCAESKDTIRVALKSTFEPRITSIPKTVCEGDSITLSVDGPINSWLWSNGDQTQSTFVKTSGKYTCVTLDSAGCTATSEITVTVNPRPRPTIQANRSLTICLDDVITLTAPPGFRKYEWNTGETSSSITTDQGGDYVVTVVDDNGCIGTSDTTRVVKLDTRNKANVQFSPGDGGVIIVNDHNVGTLACRTVRIRNISTNEPLVISRPFFVGNVYFSMPQAQFPINIAPGEIGELTLCASAIDTGLVEDTLALPDTCSVGKIPIRSKGLPIAFTGSSRCDVGVAALVISAGSSWRLSAPFPVPASTSLTITVKHVQGPSADLTATLHDVAGRVMGYSSARSVPDGEIDITLNVNGLPTGPYSLTVMANGEMMGVSQLLVTSY